MTQMNKKPKKFGLMLACNMAAECIRENYAPLSVVLSNLIDLQKSSTFPKELTKDFFKRPTPVSPSDVNTIRSIMDGLRSPNNGVANLLAEKMEDNWAFKKAPPQENKPFVSKKFDNKIKKPFQPVVKEQKTKVTPTVIIKKST